MGRVKDYILLSGGDRQGHIQFKTLDTRGNGHILFSIPLVLAAVLRIWFSALRGRVALVHVNMAERGSLLRKTFVILCVRLTRAPVVLHLHAAELIRLYRQATPFGQWIMRLPFRLATCNVVLGHLWRNWLVSELGIRSDKVAVVYNGVPVRYVPKADDEKNVTFLFLGNMQERKGLSDFMHALALLPQDDTRWQAVIAGGGYIAPYKMLADTLRITSRITFTGWVNQDRARDLLREASVLVLPSYEEGLPLVILEALGSGTPVIATAVGAIPEVLQDNNTVLFVTPGDRAAIANKMRLLVDDPTLRRSLSEKGLALYRDQFTLDTFLTNLFLVYRRYCAIQIEPLPQSPEGSYDKAFLKEQA
jgi:glycosyltransferase involved in cell wall biosynthesis